MTYVIREACFEDIPGLCTLMEQLSGTPITKGDMRNRLEMTRSSPTDTLYIYEQDHKVAGTLLFRIRENVREVSRYGEVGIIVVKSTEKRQGIGTSLMQFAEELSRKLDCKGMYLISGFGRKDEAHPFYIELGYEITGYRFEKRLIQS